MEPDSALGDAAAVGVGAHPGGTSLGEGLDEERVDVGERAERLRVATLADEADRRLLT